jgi:hypothetical protein
MQKKISRVKELCLKWRNRPWNTSEVRLLITAPGAIDWKALNPRLFSEIKKRSDMISSRYMVSGFYPKTLFANVMIFNN